MLLCWKLVMHHFHCSWRLFPVWLCCCPCCCLGEIAHNALCYTSNFLYSWIVIIQEVLSASPMDMQINGSVTQRRVCQKVPVAAIKISLTLLINILERVSCDPLSLELVALCAWVMQSPRINRNSPAEGVSLLFWWDTLSVDLMFHFLFEEAYQMHWSDRWYHSTCVLASNYMKLIIPVSIALLNHSHWSHFLPRPHLWPIQ